ncbi:MAG TPA: hypothetical protein VJY62_05500, partial [Bacteroidia bacterium]|nr:hypothetical protein [Bacteroidia bacterium]
MKHQYKKILLAFFFSLLFSFSSAQWVTIPDTNFVNWLNANGFAPCMNGNLMDTSCNAIVSTDTIHCGGAKINDLNGIQYFDSLRHLTCVNQLGTPYPLNNIPAFPPTLKYFLSWFNSFTSLPVLPDSLEVLYCYAGSLQSLPALPSVLRVLFCGSNSIDTLPALPDSLRELYCYTNYLSYLPPLPALLNRLNCSFNDILFLPALPDSLRILECGGNSNLAIPILNDSLEYFDCRRNQWTALPLLPDSLVSLTCFVNQLASLPPLPPQLEYLDFGYNPITSFPALPASLWSLGCDSINLTLFPAALPPNLQGLSCGHNPLTSLPSFPASLWNLYCEYTLISSVPDLNNSMGSVWIDNNPNLTCFPKYQTIQSLRWANTAISCLPNAGFIQSANPPITNLPLCFSVSPCEFNWSMYGKIYNDTNANCLLDTSEQLFKHLRVNLESAGNLLQSFIFNTEGYYSFKTGYGNYEIKIDTAGLPFDVVCPPSGTILSSITALDSTDEDLNFGLVCKPGFFDLVAKSISPYYLFNAGAQNKLFLNAGDASLFYGVSCSVGISGTVEAILSGPVSYVAPDSGALTPTSVILNTITWSVPDFSQVDPGKDFNIIVYVDSTATMTDTICIQLNILPAADSNPFNNSTSYCMQVFNSFDPNAKSVFPPGNIDTSQHWLTYTIFFQNTGNAPAKNISIIDTLDTDLNAASFQYLSSSHDPIIQLLPGNILHFSFPNINLPDSTNDEPNSHGYVQFKVKLKTGLTNGTLIHNTANIYFDFNPPVTTNTTENEILITTGIEGFQVSGFRFRVVPNPA